MTNAADRGDFDPLWLEIQGMCSVLGALRHRTHADQRRAVVLVVELIRREGPRLRDYLFARGLRMSGAAPARTLVEYICGEDSSATWVTMVYGVVMFATRSRRPPLIDVDAVLQKYGGVDRTYRAVGVANSRGGKFPGGGIGRGTARHQGAGNESATTPELFAYLDGRYGPHTLDPCASRTNHKCDLYFTKEMDGLAREWQPHNVFMNAPWNQLDRWIPKAVDAANKGASVTALLPAAIDTAWWHDYVVPALDPASRLAGRVWGEVEWLRGRPSYISPAGEVRPPPFTPSCVVRFHPPGPVRLTVPVPPDMSMADAVRSKVPLQLLEGSVVTLTF